MFRRAVLRPVFSRWQDCGSLHGALVARAQGASAVNYRIRRGTVRSDVFSSREVCSSSCRHRRSAAKFA